MITNLGACNGMVHLDSVCSGTFDDSRVGIGPAINTTAGAVPRFALWTKSRCSDVTFSNYEIHNMSGGVEQWGGYNQTYADGFVYDCNLDTSLTIRAALPNPEYNGGGQPIGIGWSGGAGPLNFAEFSHGTKVDNLESSNASTALALGVIYYVFWHDTHQSQFSNIVVGNAGGVDSGGFHIGGLAYNDSAGDLDQERRR